MSDGAIKLDSGEIVAKNSFTFQPMSWRFIRASLFNDVKKGIKRDWVEFFLPYKLGENQVVASILLHGFTCENFREQSALLFYKGMNLYESQITMTFEKQTKVLPDKSENTYYIGSFSFAPAPDKEFTEQLQEFAKNNRVFRAQTFATGEVMLESHLYPELPEVESGGKEPKKQLPEADEIDL